MADTKPLSIVSVLRRRSVGALVVAISLLAIVLTNAAVSKIRISGESLPEYGTWTGIAPLERKLQILRDFARQGPVDSVIIGSSIGDHGLSAAVLSADLSAAYGKQFRVFNLTTGGAMWKTLPFLYRLAHTIAKPKQIWIVYAVEQNVGDDITEQLPEYALLNAPAGTAFKYPVLLPISFEIFQLPLVHDARALQDLVIHGNFVNRPITHMDVYDNDVYGDTRGFLYANNAPVAKYADLRRKLVMSLSSDYAVGGKGHVHPEVYLSPGSETAIAEVRSLAARDGCQILILAHDSAAGFATQDAEYLAATQDFYKLISNRLGAPVIDVRESFHLEGYNFADTSHLNSIGADQISAMFAARIANRPLPHHPGYAVAPEVGHAAPYPGMTPYTAVVVQNPSDSGEELQLQYVQGPGVAPLMPRTGIQVIALLPDKSTLALPARVVRRGEVLADTSTLPMQVNGQVLLVQVTAPRAKWGAGLSLPLASYRWSGTTDTSARPKILTEMTSYTPLHQIRVSWTGIDNPTPKDWIGVFPVGGGDETKLTMQRTGGSASGTLELPSIATAGPGRYELRLYENDGWNLLATSDPFSIVPLSATVQAGSRVVTRGTRVRAVWSKLEPPSKDDWVGLFPLGGSDQSRVSLAFTAGKSDGALDLPIPSSAPEGDYELRLYSRGWNLVTTSDPFTLVSAKISADAPSYTKLHRIRASWMGIQNPTPKDWIGIFPVGGRDETKLSMEWTGGNGSGTLELATNAALKPGRYELRLYGNDSWQLMATSKPFSVIPSAATIESSSKLIKRGSRVRAIWNKLETASKDDWIGLFPRGGSDQSRLNLAATSGKPEGTVDLDVPLDAREGEYEFRLYTGGWDLLATSPVFKLTLSRLNLSIDRSAAQPGDLLRVRWDGRDSPEKNDWIGIFPKGSKETVRSVYRMTGGSVSGEVSFDIPSGIVPGEYEFRFYAHDSWQLLATSDSIQIRLRATK